MSERITSLGEECYDGRNNFQQRQIVGLSAALLGKLNYGGVYDR